MISTNLLAEFVQTSLSHIPKMRTIRPLIEAIISASKVSESIRTSGAYGSKSKDDKSPVTGKFMYLTKVMF